MSMVDFGALPPEVNSGLMYAGAGSGPMVAAAAAWDGLAAELGSAATSYRAVVSIHATYGAADAAIVTDDGPSHDWPVSSETTARYDVAAEPNSAANPSQAAAAATIGPEPAPAYIRPEFTSGGNTPKSTTTSPA